MSLRMASIKVDREAGYIIRPDDVKDFAITAAIYLDDESKALSNELFELYNKVSSCKRNCYGDVKPILAKHSNCEGYKTIMKFLNYHD